MNDILNSPIFQKLKKGELPVFEVSLNSESLVIASIAIFLAIVAALVAFKILNRF